MTERPSAELPPTDTSIWEPLVASIKSRRAPGARFFKPVCVIAAIDLADEGFLDPDSIDANAVILRFRKYVRVIYPERADQGWRPLWHLSNDGLWCFYKAGLLVTPESFGPAGKPDTKAYLFPMFDRLAIAPAFVDAWRSTNVRGVLRSEMLAMLAGDDDTCRPFARQLADPALAFKPDEWPPESARPSHPQLDLFGKETGVETDDASALDSGTITEPFDPEAIDVSTRTLSVDSLLARARIKMLDLQPDFQRRWGIWDARRQSRLIESLLLRIPLPVIYAAEDEDDRWEVVDGIQRLSTIARFVEPDIVASARLTLSGLEYLREYNGKTFEDLSEKLKLRLKETQLQIHLIRKGTPPEVKFNVFARINTGGVALSAQEMRHAITPGPARAILEDWAESPEFLKATDASVKPSRMDDRELVLRFLAFHILGPSGYRHNDMDGFLLRAMRLVNRFDAHELERTRRAFARAMNAAYDLFDNDAFRKRMKSDDWRQPINKALFEAVAVNLAMLDDARLMRLISRRDDLRPAFMTLCNDREFEASISQGTGDVAKVNRRFSDVAALFEEVTDRD